MDNNENKTLELIQGLNPELTDFIKEIVVENDCEVVKTEYKHTMNPWITHFKKPQLDPEDYLLTVTVEYRDRNKIEFIKFLINQRELQNDFLERSYEIEDDNENITTRRDV